jgi:hypothetical protein
MAFEIPFPAQLNRLPERTFDVSDRRVIHPQAQPAQEG